jgi:2-keto-4-pentenoate hydratase
MSSPATASLAADPRVSRGMRAQLARRRERLTSGERSLGWKLGFGSPAAMEHLSISAPLVGFLPASGLREPGASVPIGNWANPALEAEVAVHLARDVPPAADERTLREAIAGIGPAFELVDVNPPPEDVEEILAGNIFQRGCVLGPPSAILSLKGVTGRVGLNGAEPTVVEDPEEFTGELLGLLRHTADLLDAFGETPRAGEVLITGAILPFITVASGDRVDYELDPVGALAIRFED